MDTKKLIVLKLIITLVRDLGERFDIDYVPSEDDLKEIEMVDGVEIKLSEYGLTEEDLSDYIHHNYEEMIDELLSEI